MSGRNRKRKKATGNTNSRKSTKGCRSASEDAQVRQFPSSSSATASSCSNTRGASSEAGSRGYGASSDLRGSTRSQAETWVMVTTTLRRFLHLLIAFKEHDVDLRVLR